MAIASLDDYIASNRQELTWFKSATRTTVASVPFTLFDLAGQPGAGTLSPGNTANGVVPTDATDGYPVINAFSGSVGYLTRVTWDGSVSGNISMFDRLFVAGDYAERAETTTASDPRVAARGPNSNYNGRELWVECVTAHTGILSVQINYLDQDGNAGDTGVFSLGTANILGRCTRIPLATGDTGIQSITRVRGTVATVGTFNVMILRPLWRGRVAIANGAYKDDMLATGMPQVYTNSALYFLVDADSTSSGTPQVRFQIADK
jgi:hypothetical protein